MVNMENCFWFKGAADPVGRGHAAGKVCPVHLPFGQIKGNVCHDNRRFGSFDRDVGNTHSIEKKIYNIYRYGRHILVVLCGL